MLIGGREVMEWGRLERRPGRGLFLFGILCFSCAVCLAVPASLVAASPVDLMLDLAIRTGEIQTARADSFGSHQSPLEDVDGRPVWVLPYSFRTGEEGNVEIRDSSVTRDEWLCEAYFDSGRDGREPVRIVEYLPSRPELSRVRGSRRAIAWPLVWVVPGAFAYLGWLAMVGSVLVNRAYRRWLARGLVTEGTITGVDLVALPDEKRPARLVVRYHYATGGGAERAGSVLVQTPFTRSVELGRKFLALHDPKNPRRHIALGLLGVILKN